MTEGKEVNKQGAKYLRELITGQSHCVVENEEQEESKLTLTEYLYFENVNRIETVLNQIDTV